MAQLTIYLDDKTLDSITKSAKGEKDSVSRWVKKRLSASLETGWPEGYFNVFGALSKVDLERPKAPSWKDDRKRVEL